MQKAYTAAKIFTGDEWLQDHVVITSDGLIEKLVPLSEANIEIEDTKQLLVPAFIDAQVYGAEKKLFAEYPSPETLQIMYEKFSSEGTCLFQPTLATNTFTVFKKGIDAVRDYWKEGGKGVHGLHLEGPWISAEKRGAHVKEYIHAPTIDEVRDILEYGQDVITMITLAPEVCNQEIIDLILSYDIVISAGHSSATYEQATKNFDNRISTVTHLYNAMSGLQHRAPGLVGAVFNHNEVMASIIPDGYHVDYAAIAITKKIMKERLFAITDAVTEASTGPYQHQLAGDKYECNGTLSGSALNMHQAFYNLVHYVGLELDEALRMCSMYPAQALNSHHRYGKIAPCYSAQFVLLNHQLEFTGAIIC